jgi:hypothetical protein
MLDIIFFSHSQWDHVIAVAELDALISVSRHQSVKSARPHPKVFVTRTNMHLKTCSVHFSKENCKGSFKK